MNIIFERVLPNENAKILEVYKILKNCGEEMYRNQGLIHWKAPYPIKSIKKNCMEREVFLTKDLYKNEYVNTFQLEFVNNTSEKFSEMQKKRFNVVNVSKFATNPKDTGRGIGKKSMEFIETYCRNKGISKLSLDVYTESNNAIRFYRNMGFRITSEKPTRCFKVYVMEKQL